ncbi:hypothetical protein [Terrihalobacillus insolitus]|uniref:DUF7210 family protein n=1 Tax=Terrihalobacillus insolitus TaxID=2950438 RepID=UPI002340766C|nr:hypothetical protein [Terrihalobacillus insolitus]MDC3413961.1 hypothetical protein [Terrihalobacillus insolitus]
MKIKFINIELNEKFVHNKKVVNVGDVIDVTKNRAEDLIARGKAEAVKDEPKKKDSKE